MPEFYTWVILLNNQSEDIGERQLSGFGSRGGQFSPLMHVAPSRKSRHFQENEELQNLSQIFELSDILYPKLFLSNEGSMPLQPHIIFNI